MQAILRNSLLEMELLHKQEEMEQLELEQALAMSLAVEEERLRQLRLEAKQAQAQTNEDRWVSASSYCKALSNACAMVVGDIGARVRESSSCGGEGRVGGGQ